MSIKEATHTGSNGKYFYKEAGDERAIEVWRYESYKYKPMMFWDVHCNKWRKSIVNGTDLTPIK